MVRQPLGSKVLGRRKPRQHNGERGAASIEFALFFVILLMLFYGVAGYTVPLMLAAGYQQLASEALRDALVWKSQTGSDAAALETHVETLIYASWIPQDWSQPCEGYSGFLTINDSTGVWSLCLRHPDPDTIIPPLSIFGWEFPQLPEQIQGYARIHTREESSP